MGTPTYDRAVVILPPQENSESHRPRLTVLQSADTVDEPETDGLRRPEEQQDQRLSGQKDASGASSGAEMW